MRARVVTVCLVSVLGLAACSSSGGGSLTGGGSSGAGTTAASTGAAGSTPAPASSPAVSTPAPTSAASSADASGLQAGLLTVADLGTGYKQEPADNSESPLPCTPNDPPLNQQVPPQGRAVAQFTNTTGDVAITEDLNRYADVATASRAVAASAKGFTCQTGSLDGTPVTFTGSGKITVNGTQVDAAQGWDLKTSQFVATAILVQIGPKFVGLVLLAKPGAGQNLDIQAIVDAAAKRAAAVG